MESRLKKGDPVTLKQPVSNKPIMYVSELNYMKRFRTGESKFVGITCRWFNNRGDLCSARFNSKDLILFDEAIRYGK